MIIDKYLRNSIADGKMVSLPRIGIIGGTGEEGSALAIRFANFDFSVYIGSRSRAKSESKAEELKRLFPEKRDKIHGATNKSAFNESDVVFITIPYLGLREVVDSILNQPTKKLIVDVVVPYKMEAPLMLGNEQLKRYRETFTIGKSPSVTEEIDLYIQSTFGYKPHLVGAFKTISHRLVRDIFRVFEKPILIWGFRLEDKKRLIATINRAFPYAMVYEVPQIYWRSVEGVCEFVREATLRGAGISALNFSYR
ncbi:MAG: NAD(P)-binding domain-containing protein [Candidatus Bathyarchaeia archaeon]